MTDQQFQQIYPGWGRTEAEADAAAHPEKLGGSSGGDGGGTSVDDILNSAISAMTALVPKPVTPYDEVNPFFFDEELARRASTAEYTPYYNEMLSDYVTKVETTKSRSEEDMNRTLEQLEAGKEYYMGTQRRLLDRAVKNVNEGYAGRGLFFAGARPKDIGELEKEYDADKQNYLTDYKYQKTGTKLQNQRGLDTLNTEQETYTRDTEREKKYAIEGGVLQRQGEVRDEYEASRQKYYDNANYGGLYS